MATLTTPITQTAYNTLVDQSDIQSIAPYSNTSPQVYLTRILTRFAAASHSANTVLWGLDVTYSSGIGTNILSFTVSPGSLIIDSNIFDFPIGFSISTDAIPNTANSKLKVGIFAAYTFNAATAHNTANNVSFSSYVFDATTGALVAPVLFGGSEKVLIGTFLLDLSGPNLITTNYVGDWSGSSAILTNASSQLHVSNTSAYSGYAHITTNIPPNTLCDFTADIISGNATIKVGNTVPNSSEFLNLSSNTPTTLIGSFNNTSNTQLISLGNTTQTINNIVVFDNVQIEYPSNINLLIGDNSTFTTSIGSWTPSVVGSTTVSIGVASLVNLTGTTVGTETKISQTITLQAVSRYQFELSGVVGGTFQVLDGATIVASATADGIVKFSTTVATSYTLKYFVTSLILNATAMISQINIFSRLHALSTVDSSFTSIVNWKSAAFDNIYYAGNGLRLIGHLTAGAEISRKITVTSGMTYRVLVNGDSLAQVLIGSVVGDGSLLTSLGITDSVFVANASFIIVTLRVNSIAVNAEALFRDVNIFEDSTNVVQSIVPSNALSSNGNFRALSVANPSRTLRSSINVSGHASFISKGDSKHTLIAERSLINTLDHTICSWFLDIMKLKPTPTSLVYQITGILQ